MFDPGFYPQPGAESVVACSFDLDGLILLFVLPALTSSGGGVDSDGCWLGPSRPVGAGGVGCHPCPPVSADPASLHLPPWPPHPAYHYDMFVCSFPSAYGGFSGVLDGAECHCSHHRSRLFFVLNLKY